MAASPMYVGQRLPLLQPTFTKDAGGALDLTGATITSIMQNIDSGLKATMTGVWTISSPATAGIATYAWTATDTATPGDYYIYPVATFAGLAYNGDAIYMRILDT